MNDLNCAGIYAIKHVVSGKVYIGQSVNIAKRIKSHRKEAECTYLRNAIKCYGWDAFEVCVLEKIDDVASLNEREQYWMDTMQSYNHSRGYNIATKAGSHGRAPLSPEKRFEIKEARMTEAITVKPTDGLLTREQVAAVFSVSPRTVDYWLRTGELRRADTPGRIVRIPRSEIERRLQAIPKLETETQEPEA
jgi:group I intron endonuclease